MYSGLKGLKKSGLFVFVVAGFVAFSLSSCGREEEKEEKPPIDHPPQMEQKAEIQVREEQGRQVAQPNPAMSNLISEGEFEKIRDDLCVKEKEEEKSCIDELQTKKDDVAFSMTVIYTNTLILLKRIDSAIQTLCGLNQDIPLCGAPAVAPKDLKISPKQSDVIDTVLNLVGLNRKEIVQLTDEILQAVENIRAKGDEGKMYVLRITTPFRVKLGGAIDVWFKAGTDIRYDHFMVLGAVAQVIKALFNVIDAHNWQLDIGGILSNVSQLLNDLQNDPAGFVRRLPSTLGIDTQPNFLRFVQGGEEKWKEIPTNVSKLLYWSADGLEFFSAEENLCQNYKNALVCWDKSKNQLVFNLDPEKENIFMGEKAEGRMDLPRGFSKLAINVIVQVLRNGGDKFNCEKADNWIQVYSGSLTEFDIKKLADAVASVMMGEVTQVVPELNIARVNFCRFFGVKEATPKPIRDLLFPQEIKEGENGKYVAVDSGPYFAVEVEATRNFYVRVVTTGNNKSNPIYVQELSDAFGVSLEEISIVVNSTSAVAALNIQKTDPITGVAPILAGNYPHQGLTNVFFDGVSIHFPPEINLIEADFVRATPIVREFPEITTLFKTGVTINAVGLIVIPYVKEDYVLRGDGHRFSNVEDANGNSLGIRRDWAEPATTYLAFLKWHSKYPQDVFGGGLFEILSALGKTALLYILFRETGENGVILNGSVELDNCLVIWEFANAVSQVYQMAVSRGDESVKGVSEFILAYTIGAFLWERALGADVEKYMAGMEASLPDSVKYLSDQNGICGIVDMTNPNNPALGNIGQKSQPFKFRPATNQIVNDLLGIGLLAVQLGSALSQ